MTSVDVLTFGRKCQFIPPPWYRGGGGLGGGGWWGNLCPRGFDMLQYFETILPLVESLRCSQQDEVYFVGGGATGGLWRHQQWSPSWILPRIRNQVKIAINGNFLCLTYKIIHKYKFYFYCWKKLKKHAFSLKNGLTTCYLWRHVL